VANAFGSDVERGANGRGTVGFPGMGGEAQAGIFGVAVGVPEIGRRAAHFIAADAEGNCAIARVTRCDLRNFHDVIRAELADGIEIPPDLHAGARRGFPLRFADGAPDGIEIKTAPEDDPGSQGYFGISDALAGKGFHHAASNEGIVGGAAQALRDELEAIEETAEIGEVPEASDFFGSERRIEKHDGFPVDGAFEVQMKLCQGHIIEVPMNAAEMEAIVGGYHGDAFSVLGPHPVDTEKGKKSWVVRAFLPQARAATVVDGDGETPMERLHRDGLFAAALKREPGAYRFRIEDYDGGARVVEDPYRFGTIITDFDLHLHAEGNLQEAWNSFGSHLTVRDGVSGARFAVWAPNALLVTVVGDFNDWDPRRHPMRLRTAGVWEIFIPGVKDGDSYKYFVKSRELGHQAYKSDPFARRTEVPPKSASVVCDLSGYEWHDGGWLEKRAHAKVLREPVSIYEVHLESWMRGPAGEPLTYAEMAVKLVQYVQRMGYTHVELMPIQEYPYSGSWGYQVTGYFAPTARFGEPKDFMHLVDAFHQAGVGVIIDWVPAHFPKDAHGLAWFDGTALYEHANPMQGEQKEWGTLIFNFGRNEVREFLTASALFWLTQYHIDGLRVDAVASMLYLDYCRKPGDWIPNRFGGRENLEAIEFIRRFNELVHEVPGAVSIAEESTSFVGVSRPVYLNGLGFTMKWNMGWMHDMLDYFAEDPVNRKYYHNKITFSMMYAFSENFVLPISHDEIVYGKRSLLSKMPGDEWQKFANVRAFLAYMYGHPGKKLLFMGNDIGDYNEWDHNASVPWRLLQFPMHAGLQLFVRELNRLYREEPALHQVDFEYSGFDWIDFSDVEKSIISFVRRAEMPGDDVIFACNFTPVPRTQYRIGVPEDGFYQEILNSDAAMFGGSNMGNAGGVNADKVKKHRHPCSISVTLPPLAVVAFKRRS